MQEAQALRQAIAAIWADLPQLLGNEWPRFARTLQHLLDQLALANAATAPALCDQIFDHFYEHGAANARLYALLQWEALAVPATTKGLASALEDLQPATPTVTRYTDIELPAQVQVAQRFPLIVGLTDAPSPDSADAQPLEAPLGAEIHCMVTPGPGLVVLDKRMQPLTVGTDDSPPVVFYLRATAAGDHQLQIDFWYDGQIIAGSTQGLQAVDTAVITQTGRRWCHHPPLRPTPI